MQSPVRVVCGQFSSSPGRNPQILAALGRNLKKKPNSTGNLLDPNPGNSYFQL
jgi:hypothetical protein